jgi:hypothetical protein
MQHRDEPVSVIGAPGGDRREPLLELLDRVVDDDVQAVLLGLEVVVERGWADADVGGDVRPLGVLVAIAAEARGCGAQDLEPLDVAPARAARTLLVVPDSNSC